MSVWHMRVTFSIATLAMASGLLTQRDRVTPVEQVITLLEDLKTSITNEGTAEASTYDTFACFCKDNTKTKADSIMLLQDSIDTLSATIKAKTADRETKAAEVTSRQAEQETLAADLQASVVRCKKEQTEYEIAAADLQKAITSLENAITALDNAKTSVGSFLAVKNTVAESIDLAETLGMIRSPEQRSVSALLQQSLKIDPSDPTYKFRSKEVVDMLEDLLKKFESNKDELDTEWGKTKKACEDTQAALSQRMTNNLAAINTLKTDIEQLGVDIATSRQDLVTKSGELTDDQTYLKDLTTRCEASATTWDQRSKTRADEVAAISQALTILTEEVKSLDEQVNVRALLQQKKKGHDKVKSAGAVPVALLQEGQVAKQAVKPHVTLAAPEADRQSAAAALLEVAAGKFASPVLSSLAVRLRADPFSKVKNLIQQLIQRLLAESAAEATKKGFCDTEIGKAETDRNFRMTSVNSLMAEIMELMATKESLAATIQTLRESVNATSISLAEARAIREEEKAQNLATVQNATTGSIAVGKAIDILKDYYKSAAKASSLVQLKASPIDEEAASDPGFQGAYKGQQDGIRGVIGLLEVIKSDFQRTIKQTQDAEKQAAAGFVLLERSAKSDMSGENRQIMLDGQELRAAEANLVSKETDLKSQMDLVDAALRTIEDLKPVCIDTGMTYAERTQKRADEIAALRQALCVLDPNGNEPSCAP